MGYFLDKAKAFLQTSTQKTCGETSEKSELSPASNMPRQPEGRPEWHAQEIARAVEREGVSIFWSELHREIVAFVQDESYLSQIPCCGIVGYTEDELWHLYGPNKPALSERDLRLIHQTKRKGGCIIGHDWRDNDC